MVFIVRLVVLLPSKSLESGVKLDCSSDGRVPVTDELAACKYSLVATLPYHYAAVSPSYFIVTASSFTAAALALTVLRMNIPFFSPAANEPIDSPPA